MPPGPTPESVLARPRTAPLDPPPAYSRLCEEAPISRVTIWDGRRGAWLVTRWEDARAVLGHPAFSSDPSQPGYPDVQPDQPPQPPGFFANVDLVLWRKVREETAEALRRDGLAVPEYASDAVVGRMIEEFGRGGRAAGAGFYTYEEGKRLRLWPGLGEHFTKEGAEIPFADMQERMLFAEALETVRCFDEGVLTSVPDANIGSILGIGFPAWTGGVIQYIDGYPGGVAGFVTRADELAERYGDRFLPPDSLVATAQRGGTVR